MIVYGSSMSPYVRKVLVFASEKDLHVDNRPTPPGSDDGEFRRCSPFGQIPGLADGEFRISDSSAIVAYMEALRPEPSLIPLAPEGRARTLWYDEFADTILFEVGRKIFFNRVVAPKLLRCAGDEETANHAEAEGLPPLLDYLESIVPESGFLVEDRLTLADIAVASPWVNLVHAGVELDPDRYPRLASYFLKMLGRPSFARILDKETAFVAKMAARNQ